VELWGRFGANKAYVSSLVQTSFEENDTVEQCIYVKQFFSAVVVKAKATNKLELVDDLRCALFSINPRIEMLTHRKESQKSHENKHFSF